MEIVFFFLINGDSIRYLFFIYWYLFFIKDVIFSYLVWYLIIWYDRGIIIFIFIEKKWVFVRLIVIIGFVFYYIFINNKYFLKLS